MQRQRELYKKEKPEINYSVILRLSTQFTLVLRYVFNYAALEMRIATIPIKKNWFYAK